MVIEIFFYFLLKPKMTQQNYDKKDPPGENNIKKKNQLGY